MYGINSCGDFFMKTQKQNRKKRNKKRKINTHTLIVIN